MCVGHLYLPFLWKMSPSCMHVCVQGCYPLQWATNISPFDGKRAYPAYVKNIAPPPPPTHKAAVVFPFIKNIHPPCICLQNRYPPLHDSICPPRFCKR